MTEVKVGSIVRDNDPWMHGRTMTVTALTTKTHATTLGSAPEQVPAVELSQGPHHRTVIRLDRIHTDGKPRRSGWSLVMA